MGMAKQCVVYGLASSEDGLVRYIGQTSDCTRRRLKRHVSFAHRDKKPTHRDAWIRKVVREGHSVEMVVVDHEARWNVDEILWIAALRAAGAKLTNLTGGGEGTIDPHPALRKRIADKVSRLWDSDEYRSRQSEAHRGKPWSEARRAACEAVSAEVRSERARQGRMKLSPEHRSKVSSLAAKAGVAKRRSQCPT